MPRLTEIANFLNSAGWGDAQRLPLPGDASTRTYTRLRHGPNTAMLLNQPQSAESSACPPDASPADRERLGYNAVARLAGADTRQFAAVAAELGMRGLSAPRLLAADHSRGLLLIEDLGDARFADIIRDGADERDLYAHAVDVLLELHRHPAPKVMRAAPGIAAPLLAYDGHAMMAEVALLPDWFMPVASGAECPASARQSYLAAWGQVLSQLEEAAPVLILRDYHAENLMWLPDRQGPARVGLLDFQDALAGAPAYDLISLLEDARRDVAPALASAMLEAYCKARTARDGDFSEKAFRQEAAVLAAQRNAKIIGIFARLWKRDGKPRYLGFLPGCGGIWNGTWSIRR